MNNGQTDREGQTDGQTICPVRSGPEKDRQTDGQTHNLKVRSDMVQRWTDTQSAHAEDVACAVQWAHHATMTFIVQYYLCASLPGRVCTWSQRSFGHNVASATASLT